MKKVLAVIAISILVILGGLVSVYAVSDNNQLNLPHNVYSATVPFSPLEQQFQSHEQSYIVHVNDLTGILPVAYSSTITISALNGITKDGNLLLVVGGSTDYASVWNPLIGTYNLETGQFSDLTSQFISELSASNWYLTSAAWDGHSFLIVGVRYIGSVTVPAMALYNPHSSRFSDLSSSIPAADSNWMLSGIAWTGKGSTFMIVGFEPSSSSTGVQPVMASYTGHRFVDLSQLIPSNYYSTYFLGITKVADNYLITGWQGVNLYPNSGGILLLYTPGRDTFTDLSSLIPSNVFWLGGSAVAMPRNEVLVVGVTYSDSPAAGILNLSTRTYTDLTPSSSPNPFPSAYYYLNGAIWLSGNTFMVVGGSQPTAANSAGGAGIMGEITINQD
jgi:hypothetical protein